MFLHVTVTNEIDDLNREEWLFCLMNDTLVLDKYSRFQRESKRKRKWQRVKYYDRITKRYNGIALCDVPFDEDIQQRAFDALIRQIKVSKDLPTVLFE